MVLRAEAPFELVLTPPEERAPLASSRAAVPLATGPGAQSLRERVATAARPELAAGTGELWRRRTVTSLDYLRRRTEQRLPERRGAGEPGGDPLALVRHARRALAAEPAPNRRHPYVRHQAEAREPLARLGLLGPSEDRVHIDDGDPDHGGAVARTAAGRTALVPGGAVSLNLDGVPPGNPSRTLSAEQAERLRTYEERLEAVFRKDPPLDQLADLAAEGLEQVLLDKQHRLERLREHTPADGRRTFVNMSWGLTPDEAAQRMMGAIMTAPPRSRLRQEARRVLGRDPQNEADVDRLFRAMVYPALERAMARPEHQARMAAARTGLEAELARGRERGILVFQAAANSQEDATRNGRPHFAESSTAGVRGFITVGAVDLRRPGPGDDRMATFSSQGSISIASPGAAIPVGLERGRIVPQDGTSFAAPHALDVARAMAAANPRLSVDEIERLLTDPRAVRDLPGTDRDGAGQVDSLAAVLLARNPALTRAQLDELRQALGRGEDPAQLRARYGL